MSNKYTLSSTKEKNTTLNENIKMVADESDKKKTMRCKKLKIANEQKSLSQTDKDVVMINHQCDLERAKKELKYPVSDNTIDALELQVDKFNEMTNLSDKIKLHTTLKDSFQILEREVDDMVDIIDKIDLDTASDVIKQTMESNDRTDITDDRTDITDDIVNLEKMVAGMKEEEVMQIKLIHIQKITDIIKKCKSICDSNKMRIAKCN